MRLFSSLVKILTHNSTLCKTSQTHTDCLIALKNTKHTLNIFYQKKVGTSKVFFYFRRIQNTHYTLSFDLNRIISFINRFNVIEVLYTNWCFEFWVLVCWNHTCINVKTVFPTIQNLYVHNYITFRFPTVSICQTDEHQSKSYHVLIK